MFRCSASERPADLFSRFESHLSDRKQRQLNDSKAWHNLVYEQITSKIDEACFAGLYARDNGRPNASIRQLVTMMILKEGFGWSDEHLFEQCRFNVLTMRALGLMNLNDEIPTESTYYLFKQLHYSYQLQTGQDLMGRTFADLTQAQAELFGVSGQRIRMDSKLIGSNIATCCRLQLIVSCVQAFWQSLSEHQLQRVPQQARLILDALSVQKPHQVVYRLHSDEKQAKLEQFGLLLCLLVERFTDEDSDQYGLIRRVYEEQYTLCDEKVLPRSPQEIAAGSLQSVHDGDAAYRKKADKQVKGYSVNLTETCHEGTLNLVTDVKVLAATASDQDFVQPAIVQTETIVGPVKEVSMDGGYQSQDNWAYAESRNMQLHYGGMSGERGRFSYERTPSGNVNVIDRQTGEVIEAVAYKPGKYRFVVDGKTRYLTEQTIETGDKRTRIEQLPDWIRNRRHNVEASLFQLSYHTRNNKTRYRGRLAHQAWAFCRAAWINLVRIKNYLAGPLSAPSMAKEACADAKRLIFNRKSFWFAFFAAFGSPGTKITATAA